MNWFRKLRKGNVRKRKALAHLQVEMLENRLMPAAGITPPAALAAAHNKSLVDAAHVLRDEGDDGIRETLVIPVILHDEHRADLGAAPVGIRVIE